MYVNGTKIYFDNWIQANDIDVNKSYYLLGHELKISFNEKEERQLILLALCNSLATYCNECEENEHDCIVLRRVQDDIGFIEIEDIKGGVNNE